MQVSEETLRWAIGLGLSAFAILLAGFGSICLYILNSINGEIKGMSQEMKDTLKTLREQDGRISVLENLVNRLPCLRNGFKCVLPPEET